MRTLDLTVPAVDDLPLRGTSWLPDAAPRASVLIVHGMAEHCGRYARFAAELVAAGYAVHGYDHRGHGRTAADNGHPYGHFADSHGWELVVGDLHTLREHVQETEPDLPLFLLGHSMGSLITRVYLQRHGEGLAGAVISGTGGDPGPVRLAGLAAARIEARLRGRRTPSPLLEKLTFGAFNKPFETDGAARTGFEWLSRDEAEVDAYVADEACGYTCTTQFYADLLAGLRDAHDPRRVAQVPASLPVLLVSGAEDPVGASGAGVRTAAEQLRAAGLRDVTVDLVAGARHELLNETCRDEVTSDVISWLDAHLAGGATPATSAV